MPVCYAARKWPELSTAFGAATAHVSVNTATYVRKPASPQWLCCSSVVRNFRALATLTAGQLVSSWVRAMVTLTEARDTAQRQLDAEQRKTGKQVRMAAVHPRG